MSELDYRQILNAFADAVVMADRTGQITEVNGAAARLLDWPDRELVGKPLTTLIPARLHAAHHTGFARYLSSRVPSLIGRPVRVPALRRDGSEVEVELTLTAFRTGEAQDLFVASLRDLRDRVELERQLTVTRFLLAANAAAAKLSSHLDLDAVLATVVDTLVTEFEAALARVWLYEPATKSLLLRASAGLSTATTTSSRARIDVETYPYKVGVVARTRLPFVQNGLAGDPHFDQEWVQRENLKAVAAFPLLLGSELLGVSIYFSRRELQEEVVQVLTTFAALVTTAIHDVQLYQRAQAELAERQQAEAALSRSRDTERHFREQLAALHEVTLELASASSFVDLCRRAVELGRSRLGFERLSLWFCGDEPDVVHGSFGTDEEGQTRDEQGARVTVYPNSAFGKLIPGRVPAVCLEDVPLYSHDDVVGRGMQAAAALWNGEEAIGYLSVDNLLHGRPITAHHCELLSLYAATIGHLCTRQRAEEALRAADRRKDEFLAMLAHELRNPLASAANAAELLRRPDAAKHERARDVIERRIRQMARLVDDLLDVSRITHDKIGLRKQVLELTTVIDAAVEASCSLIEARGHTLTVSLPPKPVHLEADPARLEQILLNLLDNAAKFTEPGGQIWLTAEVEGIGGRVKAGTREAGDGSELSNPTPHTLSPPPSLVLRVRDSGAGIAPEVLPYVFDLFTQADRSLDRSQGGMGIGLTLVHRLVNLHGGSVHAESAGPDQGSEFVVRLPLRRDER